MLVSQAFRAGFPAVWSGRDARFFIGLFVFAVTEVTAIQTEIEERLKQAEPSVEVLLAEVVGGAKVRLYIDHPEGVSLDLCERVTHYLGAVRERYALEVSSPGTDRPLVKPEHFRRYQGRTVRVRLARPRDGRKTWSG